ncbi:MAG TPA: diaminopimelate decarboxylase [Acidimicrobiales bacterium]|nr:diaminopimelate decarboxylase [Acidimicrobiales bacterium]
MDGAVEQAAGAALEGGAVPTPAEPAPGARHGPAPEPDQGPLRRSLLPMTASVAPGGRLSIGGVDVLDLAERHGTPLFVYDEAHLRARCREAVGAWGEGVAYATKAFLCLEMARIAHDAGMWLDVSTGGELHVALRAGVPAARIVMHGNNKSEAELARALDAGAGRIVVDSFDEIDRLTRLVSGRGLTAPRPAVLVRVTPGVEAHTHEFVRTGQEDSKFGFGLASGAAQEAVARLRALAAVEVAGIHAHIGSQVFRVESFAEEVGALAEFFVPLGLPELCVGGGLGVPYVAAERAPTITEWAEAVHSACRRAGVPAGTRVTAEPGRSIVAGAAVTLYRIGTIKDIPGVRTYVAVDGGMSDNPRPVLYGSGYETFLPRAVDAVRPCAARVVGKHCESGDVVVGDARLPVDAGVGDILATPVTGAYGYSMASNYNKVPRPAVVFVADGRDRVVVRRETDEDLVRLDV